MADSLLDLSTSVERPVVNIDGEPYEMRDPNEFTLSQVHELATLGKKLQKLMSKDELSDSESDDLEQIGIDIVTTVMVQLPREVLDKLSAVSKMKISEAFTNRAGMSQT